MSKKTTDRRNAMKTRAADPVGLNDDDLDKVQGAIRTDLTPGAPAGPMGGQPEPTATDPGFSLQQPTLYKNFGALDSVRSALSDKFKK